MSEGRWRGIESIIDKYIGKQNFKRIFKNNRHILQTEYVPDKLFHRDKEIEHIIAILSTAFRGGRPSNILIYGKTGTGKTAAVRFIGRHLEKRNLEKILRMVYINCEIVDTEYGILSHIGNLFVNDWDERIPFTGWPTDKVYNRTKEIISDYGGVIVVVLDEIDKLVCKSGDDVLYQLMTLNEELKDTKISVIGVSNALKFTEFLDPRVQTRLGEERMVFPPYNARELKDILKDRADMAFEDGVISDDIISLCAALAAQEHGDARRALDLLRVSGELAERECAERVTERHVYRSKEKLELDVEVELVKKLPTESKVLLMSIVCDFENNGTKYLTTGEVYNTYKDMCKVVGIPILTQRRISDLISELDMLGLINARVKSFGRSGRTKEIRASISKAKLEQILSKDDIMRHLLSVNDWQRKLF